MRQYWEERYESNDSQWGWDPSITAKQTLKVLNGTSTDYNRLLDVGCGYGRDSKYFATRGYDVTGIDIARNAVEVGSNAIDSERVTLQCEDIIELEDSGVFDVVFNNFFLHLLDEQQRQQSVRVFDRIRTDRGVVVSSVASTNDSSYGSGEQVGPNTFVNDRGVTKTYFDTDAIADTFDQFDHVRCKELSEFHHHDRIHEHVLYVVFAGGEPISDTVFEANGFETL